jgi:hypothetical protein
MAHVGGDFLNDTRPFFLWYFHAANGCNDLHHKTITLAAALLTIFSGSIMALSTISLIEELAAGLKRSQRNVYSICM